MNVFAEMTDRQQSNVVSLGERRLHTPSEIVRQQLQADQQIVSAMLKELPHARLREFTAALRVARKTYTFGVEIELAIKAGVTAAENMAVERAFSDDDGPRAA